MFFRNWNARAGSPAVGLTRQKNLEKTKEQSRSFEFAREFTRENPVLNAHGKVRVTKSFNKESKIYILI